MPQWWETPKPLPKTLPDNPPGDSPHWWEQPAVTQAGLDASRANVAAEHPAAPGFLDWAFKPLTNKISSGAKYLADKLNATATDDSWLSTAKGAAAGGIEGLGNAIEGFTSPAGIAMAAGGAGAGMAGRALMPTAAAALRSIEAAGGGLMAAHGAERVIDAPDTFGKVMGGVEAAGGALGLGMGGRGAVQALRDAANVRPYIPPGTTAGEYAPATTAPPRMPYVPQDVPGRPYVRESGGSTQPSKSNLYSEATEPAPAPARRAASRVTPERDAAAPEPPPIDMQPPSASTPWWEAPPRSGPITAADQVAGLDPTQVAANTGTPRTAADIVRQHFFDGNTTGGAAPAMQGPAEPLDLGGTRSAADIAQEAFGRPSPRVTGLSEPFTADEANAIAAGGGSEPLESPTWGSGARAPGQQPLEGLGGRVFPTRPPAAHAELYRSLLEDAQNRGYTGTPEDFAQRFNSKLEEAQGAADALRPEGGDGSSDELLRAVAEAGGLGPDAGMSEEVANLAQQMHGGRPVQGSYGTRVIRDAEGNRATTTNVNHPRLGETYDRTPPINSAGVPGIPGVYSRNGLTLDGLVEALKERGIEVPNGSHGDLLQMLGDKVRAAQNPSPLTGGGMLDALENAVGVKHGANWWEPSAPAGESIPSESIAGPAEGTNPPVPDVSAPAAVTPDAPAVEAPAAAAPPADIHPLIQQAHESLGPKWDAAWQKQLALDPNSPEWMRPHETLQDFNDRVMAEPDPRKLYNTERKARMAIDRERAAAAGEEPVLAGDRVPDLAPMPARVGFLPEQPEHYGGGRLPADAPRGAYIDRATGKMVLPDAEFLAGDEGAAAAKPSAADVVAEHLGLGGDKQPALPGAEDVRSQEVPHPQVAELPPQSFDLKAPPETQPAQSGLYDESGKPQLKKGKPRGKAGGRAKTPAANALLDTAEPPKSDAGGGGLLGDEKGGADPGALIHLGTTAGGALAGGAWGGYRAPEGGKTKGMIEGALLGAALPQLAFHPEAAQALRSFGLFGSPVTVGKKILADNANVINEAFTRTVSGQGGGGKLLREVYSPQTLRDMAMYYKNPDAAMHGGFPTPEPFSPGVQKVVGAPTRALSAVTAGMKDAIMRGNLSEDEASRLTSIAMPRTALGRATVKWQQEGGPIAKYLMPVARVPINIAEMGLNATPGLGFAGPALRAMRGDMPTGTEWARAGAKQLIGLGAGAYGMSRQRQATEDAANGVTPSALQRVEDTLITAGLGARGAVPNALGAAMEAAREKHPEEDSYATASRMGTAAKNALARALPLPTGLTADVSRWPGQFAPGALTLAGELAGGPAPNEFAQPDLLDSLIARIPGLNQWLLERKPVPGGGSLGSATFKPMEMGPFK